MAGDAVDSYICVFLKKSVPAGVGLSFVIVRLLERSKSASTRVEPSLGLLTGILHSNEKFSIMPSGDPMNRHLYNLFE